MGKADLVMIEQLPRAKVARAKSAIIGFGRLAQAYYVPALRKLSMVDIVAIADPLPASRAAAASAFPRARIYDDYRDLFAREHVDAILVASPPSTHLAIWNEAARRRIPAFVEKPFVIAGELERVEGPSDASHLLMLNFNRRFWPAYRKLRELCASARIGDVERADFTLRTNIRPWNSVTTHRLAPGEGGALYDLAGSELDLIEFVFQEKIASIRAQSETIVWPGDQVRLNVQLERGLRVSCDIGYDQRNCEKVVIVGSKAIVRIENPNARVHVESAGSQKTPVADWLGDTFAFGLKALRRERSMLRYTITASLAAFFEALLSGQPFSPGFDDAIWNASCLEAAVRSIREKKFIEVSGPQTAAHFRKQHA
jgi:myo-inositol 2-dehydrogenase/D-chiro-inositol 1-dehydrogenase